MDSTATQPAPATGPGVLEPLSSLAELEDRYFRVENWQSQLLPTPRDLFFYLPTAYVTEPQRSFPVLVLHDGQNLFDGDLSYVRGSTWRAGSTLDAEIVAGRVEPVILVGVGNAGVERMAEYTPSSDRRLGGGLGPQYARLLVEELLPMVRGRFRTSSGPENTGLAGSSLGGLISLAIGLRYPHIFGKVGVVSPSIWWDNRAILRDVRSLPGAMPLRIWLDIGTGEGLLHVRDTDLLTRLLESKGWRPGPEFHSEHIPGGLHNEEAWAARFGRILQFLFPAGAAAPAHVAQTG